jgi:hypothetical protein
MCHNALFGLAEPPGGVCLGVSNRQLRPDICDKGCFGSAGCCAFLLVPSLWLPHHCFYIDSPPGSGPGAQYDGVGGWGSTAGLVNGVGGSEACVTVRLIRSLALLVSSWLAVSNRQLKPVQGLDRSTWLLCVPTAFFFGLRIYLGH